MDRDCRHALTSPLSVSLHATIACNRAVTGDSVLRAESLTADRRERTAGQFKDVETNERPCSLRVVLHRYPWFLTRLEPVAPLGKNEHDPRGNSRGSTANIRNGRVLLLADFLTMSGLCQAKSDVSWPWARKVGGCSRLWCVEKQTALMVFRVRTPWISYKVGRGPIQPRDAGRRNLYLPGLR